MAGKALMLQGTGSHVGKSVLVTALCRLLKRQGLRVAPFKGMNMSNNASVTADGKEIATAQVVQAAACGIDPDVRMNPVLLKPTSDCNSQVVVLGQAGEVARAHQFPERRQELLGVIQESLTSLMAEYDCVVIEGAGSPAEVNLQEWDIANMAVARMAQIPVLLIGDIERGGVFAQLVGTLALLAPEDRGRVRGFLINKFRGERSLLDSGLRWLETRTGLPVCGVIPYLHDLAIPQEDGLGVPVAQPFQATEAPQEKLIIEVIRFPAISNSTDFEPLERIPEVDLRFLTAPPQRDSCPDLILLPGTKATVADLAWMRTQGWDRYLERCLESGSEIGGICGGFQMLGERIDDPAGAESDQTTVTGLGLLPTTTLFLRSKVTAQVRGIHPESGEPVAGYEIHMGRIRGLKHGKPLFHLTQRTGSPVEEWDGCRLEDRPVWGTYLHGLFDSEGFRCWFVDRLMQRKGIDRSSSAASAQDPFEALADVVGAHLDLNKLEACWPSTLSV